MVTHFPEEMTTMRLLSLLSLIFLVRQTFCYQPTSRRDFFSFGTAAACTLATSQPANAVLSSKYCASGVGEGCADLSEGNALIKSLQEKSAANKEMNMQVRIGNSAIVCVLGWSINTFFLTAFLLYLFRRPASSRCLLHEELPRLVCCSWESYGKEARWNFHSCYRS